MKRFLGWALLALAPVGAADEVDGLKSSVSAAGDVDLDGCPDVLVATRSDREERVWVLSGRDGAVLLDLVPSDPNDRLGRALAPAGDVDGDGYPDLLVAAHFPRRVVKVPKKKRKKRRPDGARIVEYEGEVTWCRRTASAAVYVFSGRDGSVIHRLASSDDEFGFAVAGGVDLDGDDRPDVAVGAPCSLEGRGSVSVFSGVSGALLGRVVPRAGEGVTWLRRGQECGCVGDDPWGPRRFGTAVATVRPVDGTPPRLLASGIRETAQSIKDDGFQSVSPEAFVSVVEAGPPREQLRVVVPEGRSDSLRIWELVAFPDATAGRGGYGFCATKVDDWWRVYDGCGELVQAERWSWNPTSAFSSVAPLMSTGEPGACGFVLGHNERWPFFFDQGRWEVWRRNSEVESRKYREEWTKGQECGVDVCSPGDLDGDGEGDIAVVFMDAGAEHRTFTPELHLFSGRTREALMRVDLTGEPRVVE